MDYVAIGKKEVYRQRALKCLGITPEDLKVEEMKVVTVKEWENLKNQIKELKISAFSHKNPESSQIKQPILQIILNDPQNLNSHFTNKEIIKELTKELLSSAYT